MSVSVSVLLYLSTYLLSALLLNLAARSVHKKVRIVFFIFALIPPCLLAGLRYHVGTDYTNYYNMFVRNANLTFYNYLSADNQSVLGIYLISRIAGCFDSFELYFFLLAVVIYAPVAWRIMEKKDSEPVVILALVFLMGSFTCGFNIIKQTAAMSICLFGLKYIYEGKFLKYVITIVLAATFHITAIICFPIYFIWQKRQALLSFNVRSWLVVIGYVIITLNFSKLAPLLGDRFSGYGTEEVQGGNLSLLLGLAWLFIFLFFNKAIVNKDPQSGLLIVMLVIGNVLALTGLRNIYTKRIGEYFTYSQFILLPQLRYGFTKGSRPIILALVLIYSVAMFILSYVILGHSDVIPYVLVPGLM